MATSTQHQFFVACKRAPVRYERHGERLVPLLASGGTANVVAELTAALSASLVATATTDDDRELLADHPCGAPLAVGPDRSLTLQLLSHDDDVFWSTQDYFCPEVMWPAMHNLWEQWHEPVFDHRIREAWTRFQIFNRNYAEALLTQSADAPNPVYLLQDYQLVVAAARLREARPDGHIQVFLHCSWGSPDSWRVPPKEVRSGILEAMCAADSVGFFCTRWAHNFLSCVDEFVEAATVDWGARTVEIAGRICHVRVVPLGYSPETISELRMDLPEPIHAWVGDSPLVVTYGRTDPVKNTPRAIEAFRRARLSDERLHDAKLLVRLAPNHLHVLMNRRYRQDIDDAVRRLVQSTDDDAVMVVEEGNMAATLASYVRADVLLFTAITEGQNLGPFEGVIVNERCAGVVLSEMAGGSEVLRNVASIVNPFDVDEQAEAIRAILLMTPEARALDAKQRHSVVEQYPLQAWVGGQLAALPS